MKSTGVVRRIDDLGRVVIPKELRRTRGIKTGDPMEIFVTADSIVLKKYHERNVCVLCDKYIEDSRKVNGRLVCNSCMSVAWAVIQGESHAES